MDGKMEVHSHYLRLGFDETTEYLEMRKKILSVSPDMLVIIDPYTKRDWGLREILEGFLSDLPFNHLFYSIDGNDFHIPNDEGILMTVVSLKEKLAECKKVYVIVPLSIRHFVFIMSVLNGHKHPAYNDKGELNFDSRWILEKTESGNYDSTLRNAVGYAMPYPDATGHGARLLEQLSAAETGLDYGVLDSGSGERVLNSIRLAESPQRVSVFRDKLIKVDTYQFGWFHTGTLMALLREKYPDAIMVLFTNDNGSSAKKKGYNYTLAAFRSGSNLERRLEKCNGKKLFVTPLFVHLELFPELGRLEDGQIVI